MPKNIIYLLFGVLLASGLTAQGDLNSPFSKFGIGNLSDRGYMNLRQMGGLGSSFYDIYHLNFENPATLAHLKATAFDIGLEMQNSRLSDNQNSASIWSGNLSYLGLGFPMRNPLNEIFTNEDYTVTWGMGFSLTPISSIDYDISKIDSVGEIGNFQRSYTGNGGFYKATWGNAIKYKDLSIGANIGFMFGKDEYTRLIDFSEITAYDNSFNRVYTARGIYADFGLLYTLHFTDRNTDLKGTFKEPRFISFGITARPNTGFSTKSEIADINVLPASNLQVLTDTLFYQSELAGNGTMPGELGFGMTYHHENKFAIGIDIKRTFWSSYKNDAKPEELNNTMRVALGGYYRPNYKSINSFLSRVHYRFGVYFQEDPRTLNSSSIDNYGLTLGLGLPFSWQRKFSHMNIGLNVGKRAVDNILRETFVKLQFGFTFNDNEWFIKRKYN